MKFSEIVLAGAAALGLIAIWCMASEMDYQDSKLEEQHTCWMVQEGKWPAVQAEGFDCPAMPRQLAGVE